jgi:uncharacterized protein
MIRSVSADGIQIGADLYDRTIALTVDMVLETWADKDIADLEESDFSALLEVSPEVIVLGTGAANIFPPRELVFAMARRRVGFEVMDTAAAARTYNVLAGEGRQVAAVLYLPHE